MHVSVWVSVHVHSTCFAPSSQAPLLPCYCFGFVPVRCAVDKVLHEILLKFSLITERMEEEMEVLFLKAVKVVSIHS